MRTDGIALEQLRREWGAHDDIGRTLLSVRAAELYYEREQDQDEIGSLLGLTRWKVGRLLSQARELGIVQNRNRPSRAKLSSNGAYPALLVSGCRGGALAFGLDQNVRPRC
jgi:hypothetical protein